MVLDFYKPSGGSYSLDHRYLYGPAVDQVLAQENLITRIGYTSVASIPTSDTSRVYWLLTDNLGTVRDILNKNGELVSGGHFKYDAFGQFASDNTGDVTLTRYLFTAREFDSITGLQYNRNRWYDSKTGRWLSEDPIGFAGGDYNLYRYVGNDPTNATDPSGTSFVDWKPRPKPPWWPDWFPDWDELNDPKNANPADLVNPIGPLCGIFNFTAKGLSQSKVIARGAAIDKVAKLVEKFGGTAGGWVKKKGYDVCGREIHWYEHKGIGRVGEKVAGDPDPF